MGKYAAEQVPEQAIGYDARDYRDNLSSLWAEGRKKQFLYRLDVRKVLSVDTRVWPSIFSALSKPTPAHQESLQDLWASESKLREALSLVGQAEALPAFRTTIVTLIWDSTGAQHPLAPELASFVEEPCREHDWQFVGFDVADAFLLSTLSNCGFMQGYDDAIALRKEWGPLLNEFHLFTDLDAARAFRAMSNVRLVNDHAPAFIYGLHVRRLPQ